MKILQVASSLHDWGGIERYVQYLTDGLIARGHEVVVACPAGSHLDRKITSRKVAITMMGKYNPLSAAPYLRLFRQERFDVVHTHFSPDFQMPAWAARVTRQRLIVMTRHVVLPWPERKVRTYLKLYDRIIPVSEAVRKRLLESAVPADRMTVAKAGVPALKPKRAPDEMRQELGVPMDRFAAGSFGRLVKEKGTEVFLQAVASAKSPLWASVFGDGPEKDSLQKLCGPTVRMHGQIENVADAMNAMDAVVIPSVWEEAFPYSALEALSIGKPIVASDVGGMPELVQPGVNGYLFPKGDANALARHLEVLANDPAIGMALGSAGQAIHRSTYTIQKMAERIEKVYSDCLGL